MLFFIEREYMFGRRYRLTSGSGIIAAICLVTAVWLLFDKEAGKIHTLIVEDIFKINTGGCVVMGVIKGTMVAGVKVIVEDRNGNIIKTKIHGMEIQGR